MKARWKKQRNLPLNELAGNCVLADLEARGENTRNINSDNEFESDSAIYIGRANAEEAALKGGKSARHWSDLSWNQMRRCSTLATSGQKRLYILFITFSTSRRKLDYWSVPAELITQLLPGRTIKTSQAYATHIKRSGERDMLWDELDVTPFHREIPFEPRLKVPTGVDPEDASRGGGVV
jgi:hypothetical protein